MPRRYCLCQRGGLKIFIKATLAADPMILASGLRGKAGCALILHYSVPNPSVLNILIIRGDFAQISIFLGQSLS
jgi:hypothetical protein